MAYSIMCGGSFPIWNCHEGSKFFYMNCCTYTSIGRCIGRCIGMGIGIDMGIDIG